MMKKLCLAATLLLSLIGALTLSAAPSKQIMSLEYFYAKDGTITGRSVNGRMQTYQYDKRGQLLAVVDSKGQAVEKYVYDRAGNILEKTVNGVTTTYTYDKANQLVSSTVEGKVTSYRYDAAGRLVKEGDKSYRYGYLDKVLAVYENGENTANFDYHLDGQIASATRNGETENFTWDGLALIHRGSNTFINEPYVTGGNPLLSSKGGVMFNDMLGSTLGLKDGSNLETASMSAFGETADNAVFFTGKPKVDELGYAFLFRNYRAEQGKWQTADPLGYPDGWNNLAYVNNWITEAIDRLGTEILICREVVDGVVKHQWLEIHRNGEITAAAGFYPSGGSLYGTGQINIGKDEGHITDRNKDVVAIYRTTALQEKALMEEIIGTYVPNPPFYTIYPPQYVCYDWTDDIRDMIEDAWDLGNALNNATTDELSQWGTEKASKNINDVTKMPE